MTETTTQAQVQETTPQPAQVTQVQVQETTPQEPKKKTKKKTKPGERTPKRKLKVPKPKNVLVSHIIKDGKKVGARVARAVTPGKDGSRPWGPGTKMFKFKPLSLRGECDVLGCKSKAYSPKAFRCMKHKKEIRKAQLAENNKVWHRRCQRGDASHHVVYTSPVTGRQELTEWARANPSRALKQVARGDSIVTVEQFKKLLAETKKAEVEGKLGAKGRVK